MEEGSCSGRSVAEIDVLRSSGLRGRRGVPVAKCGTLVPDALCCATPDPFKTFGPYEKNLEHEWFQALSELDSWLRMSQLLRQKLDSIDNNATAIGSMGPVRGAYPFRARRFADEHSIYAAGRPQHYPQQAPKSGSQGRYMFRGYQNLYFGSSMSPFHAHGDAYGRNFQECTHLSSRFVSPSTRMRKYLPA